jgi:hypothetical protein
LTSDIWSLKILDFGKETRSYNIAPKKIPGKIFFPPKIFPPKFFSACFFLRLEHFDGRENVLSADGAAWQRGRAVGAGDEVPGSK